MYLLLPVWVLKTGCVQWTIVYWSLHCLCAVVYIQVVLWGCMPWTCRYIIMLCMELGDHGMSVWECTCTCYHVTASFLCVSSLDYRVGWVSKASANQRAGRAGRTAPGHCYRSILSNPHLSILCLLIYLFLLVVLIWLSISFSSLYSLSLIKPFYLLLHTTQAVLLCSIPPCICWVLTSRDHSETSGWPCSSDEGPPYWQGCEFSLPYSSQQGSHRGECVHVLCWGWLRRGVHTSLRVSD